VILWKNLSKLSELGECQGILLRQRLTLLRDFLCRFVVPSQHLSVSNFPDPDKWISKRRAFCGTKKRIGFGTGSRSETRIGFLGGIAKFIESLLQQIARFNSTGCWQDSVDVRPLWRTQLRIVAAPTLVFTLRSLWNLVHWSNCYSCSILFGIWSIFASWKKIRDYRFCSPKARAMASCVLWVVGARSGSRKDGGVGLEGGDGVDGAVSVRFVRCWCSGGHVSILAQCVWWWWGGAGGGGGKILERRPVRISTH